MIFSEVYSCYFQAVAKILGEAAQGSLTKAGLDRIVRQTAFEESIMVIPDALERQEWPLLTKEMETPIQHVPTQPLTYLQERWMKSLLLDPRIQLFDPDTEGFDDVEPLFYPDMFVYYDRYQDGDPYGDEAYIQNFRTVLKALQEKQSLQVVYTGRTGIEHETAGIPLTLEYSAKDDKFRLRMFETEGNYREITEINMARIRSCRLAGPAEPTEEMKEKRMKKKVVIELADERNALVRAMMHFSYLEKETEQLDEKHYRITLYYDRNDENEILIQLLSFGAMVKVTGPEEFREKIRERIERQKKYSGRAGRR